MRIIAGICLMIFIFTGCGNHTTSKKASKKEIDYDLVKMDKDKEVKYPKEESQVEVVGTFETYQIDGDNNKYCRLGNAIIK